MLIEESMVPSRESFVLRISEMSRVPQKSSVIAYFGKEQEEEGIGSMNDMKITSEHWP